MIDKPELSNKPTKKGIAWRMRRSILVSAIAAATMGAVAGAADATTFSGRCTGTGLITSDPPLGYIPAYRTLSYASSGHCTGTLDGLAVRDVRFEGLATAEGVFFCSNPTASPSVVITFRPPNGPRRRLYARADAVIVGTTARFVLQGASEGVAHGLHDAVVDGAAGEECMAGTLRSIGWTVSFATITPLVG